MTIEKLKEELERYRIEIEGLNPLALPIRISLFPFKIQVLPFEIKLKFINIELNKLHFILKLSYDGKNFSAVIDQIYF